MLIMSNQTIRLDAIAAMCYGNGIGADSQRLPWSLPKEYAYFMRVVTRTKDARRKNAIIMGRLTWFSVDPKSRPIGNCLNIIISTSLKSKQELGVENDKNLENCEVFVSLEEAMEFLKQKPDLIESVYAVGGTQVYKAAMESSSFGRFFLTRILADFNECNIFIEPKNFLQSFRKLKDDELVDQSKLFECDYNHKHIENGVEYIFEVYERQKDEFQ